MLLVIIGVLGCNCAVAFLLLKIRSGTSPFMTTNTSATFLVIVKGESCLYCIVVTIIWPLMVYLLACPKT